MADDFLDDAWNWTKRNGKALGNGVVETVDHGVRGTVKTIGGVGGFARTSWNKTFGDGSRHYYDDVIETCDGIDLSLRKPSENFFDLMGQRSLYNATEASAAHAFGVEYKGSGPKTAEGNIRELINGYTLSDWTIEPFTGKPTTEHFGTKGSAISIDDLAKIAGQKVLAQTGGKPPQDAIALKAALKAEIERCEREEIRIKDPEGKPVPYEEWKKFVDEIPDNSAGVPTPGADNARVDELYRQRLNRTNNSAGGSDTASPATSGSNSNTDGSAAEKGGWLARNGKWVGGIGGALALVFGVLTANPLIMALGAGVGALALFSDKIFGNSKPEPQTQPAKPSAPTNGQQPNAAANYDSVMPAPAMTPTVNKPGNAPGVMI